MNDRVQMAWELCQKAHHGQFRKDGKTPYCEHPLEVYRLVVEHSDLDEDAQLAALLHDTLEDTDMEPAEIQKQFGNRVLHMVRKLTKPKPDRGNCDLDESEFRRMVIHDAAAKVVETPERRSTTGIKAADRTANLREMKTQPWEWQEDYLEESERLQATIARHAPAALAVLLDDEIERSRKRILAAPVPRSPGDPTGPMLRPPYTVWVVDWFVAPSSEDRLEPTETFDSLEEAIATAKRRCKEIGAPHAVVYDSRNQVAWHPAA